MIEPPNVSDYAMAAIIPAAILFFVGCCCTGYNLSQGGSKTDVVLSIAATIIFPGLMILCVISVYHFEWAQYVRESRPR